MKRNYDIVFVTHLPAFYKVNLYRAIAKTCRVFVIFIAQSSQIRAADFTPDLTGLDHVVLDAGNFESRSVLKNIFKLRRVLKNIAYQKIIVGGWDLIEFWWVVFYSKQKQNALALESSWYESQKKGWRKWLKQLFLSRVSLVLPSGKPHQALIQALGFKGDMKTTLGVGIFNYSQLAITANGNQLKVFQGRFLFVGRLAPEKNIALLLSVFAKHPQWHLTIVGEGPLSRSLKKQSPPNVSWMGYVSNHQLAAIYQEHDVFILPSLKEPWGLVVEEALYHGLPVVASHHVGCASDLLGTSKAGYCFDPNSEADLSCVLQRVSLEYPTLKAAASLINFEKRDAQQVAQYIEAIS